MAGPEPLGGLTSAEAAVRLAEQGPNVLPRARRRPLVLRFGDQLVGLLAVMLWTAAGLALAASMPQLTVAIVVVVLFNAVFAFIQEARADRAADRLRDLLPRDVTVRRDRRPVEVAVAEVVTADVVLLEPGDRVPADARVLRADQALVDESMLTGESVPRRLASDDDLSAGTFLVEGAVEALVTATGRSTRLAGLVALTGSASRPPSPLTFELRRVARTVALIALAVGALFFALVLVLGRSAADGLIFAIGVTVALVPEALLPTVTLSLAWGAEQMARRNVLVRNLEAVETLGSTTFICTDKTGTLTRNEMAVVRAWTPAGTASVAGTGYEPTGVVTLDNPDGHAEVAALARAAARCSTGYVELCEGAWRPHGDPMEVALDVFARRLGLDPGADREQRPATARFPFDPRTKLMAICVGDEVIVKGAPESLLPRCAESADAEAADAEAAVESMAEAGLRVLAVARRPLCGSAPSSADEAERDLQLVGLVGLQDPPRQDVGEALERCRRAGIRVAMVTGDHPATARAVGAEVGLCTAAGRVVSGDELPADEQLLGALVDRDGIVIARVSPEDKLRIARALRARGHVVAMTGDGVNDGPALHEADIGVAMGRSGTDVAREAADLVLLDDHFASIVAGVEQGRATYSNVRRFLTYHLTDNVAELTPFLVWALSAGHFPLALGVLQVLALDIGTDTFSAVALGAEPPGRHVLEDPPISGRLMSPTVIRRAFLLLGPTEAAASMAAFLTCLAVGGWRVGAEFPHGPVLLAASGAAFLTVVLAQCANAFACRSASRYPWQLGWFGNHLLLAGVAFGLVASLVSVFVEPIASALGQAPPPLAGWLVALAAVPTLFVVDALDKRWRRHRTHRDAVVRRRP